jgi:hypothetical protein
VQFGYAMQKMAEGEVTTLVAPPCLKLVINRQAGPETAARR